MAEVPPPAYGVETGEMGYVAYPQQTGPLEKTQQPTLTAYVTQPTATATVIQTTTPQGPPPEYLRKRAENGLAVVLVLMVVVFIFGVVMIICNAIPAARGVRTYDNWYASLYGNPERVRRDWYQGIWSGVVHTLVATAFFVIHHLARKNGFDLDRLALRGWLYFFTVLLSLMAVMAFVVMILGAITASFLYNKDGNNFFGASCSTQYDPNHDVYCVCSGYERVENSNCDDAGRLYYGLFTTIAVLNAATVVLFIVAASFTCAGSCISCCGGGGYAYTYGAQSVVVPSTMVVQGVPQTVQTIQYPVGGHIMGTY